MDLSKAFDTTDIDIFNRKLQHYGIRGLALDWFSSYLYGREQYVYVKANKTLNTEISKTDKWFKCHKYSVNASKTNYMIFRTQQKQDYAERVHLGINGQTISRVSTINFLGIILDECPNFKGHIDALVKKLSKYVDLLTKLRYFLPS